MAMSGKVVPEECLRCEAANAVVETGDGYMDAGEALLH